MSGFHLIIPIKAVHFDVELRDVALIELDFEPEEYFEIASDAEESYLIDEIRSPGESGMGMVDDENKLCGVLSKMTPNGCLYEGLKIENFIGGFGI